MANSFASLSLAFAWGSIGLGVVAIIAGVTWAKIVANEAKNEARTEAANCAKLFIEEWLRVEAPVIVRTHVELLSATSGRSKTDDAVADDLGNAAG